MNNEDNYSM